MKIIEQWVDGRAIQVRGRRKHVLRAHAGWLARQDPVAVEEPEEEREPEKSGASAMVEHAGRRHYESEASYFGGVDVPIVQAKSAPIPTIGFAPNPVMKEAA